jgi:hypothetical protein
VIPPLDENGYLPEGIHDCTMDEVAQRFGGFHATDRRPTLWARFADFAHEVKACEVADAVFVDGSFVTAEPAPNDIDLILVVSGNHDFTADFKPSEYNVLSKRRVNRRFGFDLLVARADSEEYRRYVEFFPTSPVGSGPQKKHTADTTVINKNFAIMAEGPVDEIRKLQADIDSYIHRLEAVDTTA